MPKEPNMRTDLGVQQNDWVDLRVQVVYPGSRISTILIGDTQIKIRNSKLRAAHQLHGAHHATTKMIRPLGPS